MIVKTYTLNSVKEAKELLLSLEQDYHEGIMDDFVDRKFFVTEDEDGIVQFWSEDNTYLYFTAQRPEARNEEIKGIKNLVVDDYYLAEELKSKVIEAKIKGDTLEVRTERGIINPF